MLSRVWLAVGLAVLIVWDGGQAVAPARAAPASADSAVAQESALPVSITISATGETVPRGGTRTQSGLNDAEQHSIVVRVDVQNDSSAPLENLTIIALWPGGTRVAASWLGSESEGSGAQVLPAVGAVLPRVQWVGLNVGAGARLGPLAYRLVSEETFDGATVFRQAGVVASVSTTGSAFRYERSGELPLSGLWGEHGLRRTLLPSGLTVFTRERPDTMTVAVRMAVGAGSRDEDPAVLGGAHWLEHGYFLGTQRRPSSFELTDEIATVGGEMNASTSFEATNYWLVVPAARFGLALDVLSDQLLHSTFRPDLFDRERRVVVEELRMRADDPPRWAGDEFLQRVFRESPLRQHPVGSVSSVQTMPREAIFAYRDRLYVAGNMALAIAGPIEHDAAVTQARQAFAALPRGPRLERPQVAEPRPSEPTRLVLGNGSQSTEIRLGWPVPGRNSPDAAAIQMIQEVLGTSGRWLPDEMRLRQVPATNTDATYAEFRDAGTLVLSASAPVQAAPRAIDALLAGVARVRNGEVGPDDLAASLRAVGGRAALRDESNSAQTRVATAEVTGLVESPRELLARLARVSAADVQRVALDYLDLENYTLVSVQP